MNRPTSTPPEIPPGLQIDPPVAVLTKSSERMSLFTSDSVAKAFALEIYDRFLYLWKHAQVLVCINGRYATLPESTIFA